MKSAEIECITNFTHNLDNKINVKYCMKFMKEKQPTSPSKDRLFLFQWPESTPKHGAVLFQSGPMVLFTLLLGQVTTFSLATVISLFTGNLMYATYIMVDTDMYKGLG